MLLRVDGGIPLSGVVKINGAKNSALPIMAACILFSQEVTLKNIPNLLDVSAMSELLTNLGSKIRLLYNPTEKVCHTITISCKDIYRWDANYSITSRMRASCLILGPVLSRLGRVEVALPGGCNIGARPVDMHLWALEKMGATIEVHEQYFQCHVRDKLRGCEIDFRSVSVGATETALMAAVTATGVTVIRNAATEPEVVDLVNFLVKAGAKVYGKGTRTLVVHGVEALQGCDYTIIADRLEAGTYALAAIATGGEIHMIGIDSTAIKCLAGGFAAMGGKITTKSDGITISSDTSIKPVSISTGPYPMFPSDMQAQFAATLCLAAGTSYIQENVFENRFAYIRELTKMGARIDVQARAATIYGVQRLQGTRVAAPDLRASAALLIAGLSAEGTTIIDNAETLHRGYEAIEEKLRACGAIVEPSHSTLECTTAQGS